MFLNNVQCSQDVLNKFLKNTICFSVLVRTFSYQVDFPNQIYMYGFCNPPPVSRFDDLYLKRLLLLLAI